MIKTVSTVTCDYCGKRFDEGEKMVQIELPSYGKEAFIRNTVDNKLYVIMPTQFCSKKCVIAYISARI